MMYNTFVLSITLMSLKAPTVLGFGVTRPSYHPINLQKRRASIHLQMALDVNELEAQAIATSEAWGIDTTQFFDSNEAAQIEEKLCGRADVTCLRLGGRPNSVRARFVLTHPDLGMDVASAEAEHCRVLSVTNVDLGRADPWPNVLTSIGVDLEKVGDIIEDGPTAFLVVDPDIAKTCSRLLPKELPGSGVTVEELVPGDEVIPDGGTLQDMEIQRLDKRE
eukprot:CAMPEP_0194248490 /NCGR_PEP_ID=MMETSP0158-20130606/18491_1 /TAXON_ID=33649 /ORGANISM="Thalassionema nitzschioides, Strain L26-B" /LENGTH=220 /DNA_ID=CAMNT_0038984799 /DNA_START=70 /DNA_END=729 /DNA_ORIENTATION=-